MAAAAGAGLGVGLAATAGFAAPGSDADVGTAGDGSGVIGPGDGNGADVEAGPSLAAGGTGISGPSVGSGIARFSVTGTLAWTTPEQSQRRRTFRARTELGARVIWLDRRVEAGVRAEDLPDCRAPQLGRRRAKVPAWSASCSDRLDVLVFALDDGVELREGEAGALGLVDAYADELGERDLGRR